MFNIKNIRELGIKQGFLAEGKKGINNLLGIFKRFMKLLNIPFYDECCPDSTEPLPVGYTESDETLRYYNPATKQYDEITVGGGGGGDFIPLAGTEVGKPVTGSIEVVEGPIMKLLAEGGNNINQLEFSEGGVGMVSSASGIGGASLLVVNTGIFVDNTGTSPFGIKAASHFPNKDSLTYAQMQDVALTVQNTNSLFSTTLNAGENSLATNSILIGVDAGKDATNIYDSVFLGREAGLNATDAGEAQFIGLGAGKNAPNAYQSTFIGYDAGKSSTDASQSVFLGSGAGFNSPNAYQSNFIGYATGSVSGNAYRSNFMGFFTGYSAPQAFYSNFFGYNTGLAATNARHSNFFGYEAGRNATNANYSNFIGSEAGRLAQNASYCTLIGHKVGSSFLANEIGSNNIIIGNNISLPGASINSINLGGVLFGINTYATTTGDPSIVPTSTGMIGIGVVNPTAKLHIAASTTLSALMKLEVGPAPTSPNDGDIWLESNSTTGLKIRLNGVTRTITIT